MNSGCPDRHPLVTARTRLPWAESFLAEVMLPPQQIVREAPSAVIGHVTGTLRSLPRHFSFTCMAHPSVVNPRSVAAVVLFPLLIALGMSGCSPAATTPVATGAPETVAKAPKGTDSVSATSTPIDPDSTVVLTAVATAANGSKLDLKLVVHQSTPFDDVASQTVPVAVTADCGGTLSATVFSTGLWSFTRANISAVPSLGSAAVWPASSHIDVMPSASLVKSAGRGILSDAGYSGGDPACIRDKFFGGPGNGGLAVGIPGDSPVAGTAGRFTRWAKHSWGFAAATGVVLTDCSAEITPLGSRWGGGAGTVTTATDSRCIIGPPQEPKEY